MSFVLVVAVDGNRNGGPLGERFEWDLMDRLL